MLFVIRPAVSGDAPALLAMNAAFNGDTGTTEEAIRRNLLSCPETVLIAECKGTPAGFCCAQVHHSFCYPTPVAEVTEMYVEEAFRRQGCASAMLHALEELLARQGVGEMHLLTGTANTAAQAAYERAGFRRKIETYMLKEVRVKR